MLDLQILVQAVHKVCILSNSRTGRDLCQDVKDLGCCNSEVEQRTLSKNSMLLLHATAFWCGGWQHASHGSLCVWRVGCSGALAEVEARPFAPCWVEAHLFSG